MFQEHKKTKEHTYLVKHDFEVIKLSGKPEKDESRFNTGTETSKCQNFWCKRKRPDQGTSFIAPMPGEATTDEAMEG